MENTPLAARAVHGRRSIWSSVNPSLVSANALVSALDDRPMAGFSHSLAASTVDARW